MGIVLCLLMLHIQLDITSLMWDSVGLHHVLGFANLVVCAMAILALDVSLINGVSWVFQDVLQIQENLYQPIGHSHIVHAIKVMQG